MAGADEDFGGGWWCGWANFRFWLGAEERRLHDSCHQVQELPLPAPLEPEPTLHSKAVEDNPKHQERNGYQKPFNNFNNSVMLRVSEDQATDDHQAEDGWKTYRLQTLVSIEAQCAVETRTIWSGYQDAFERTRGAETVTEHTAALCM